MPRTSRGSVPWFGRMATASPHALSLLLLLLAAVLLATAVGTVDASPRGGGYSRMRGGSFQQGPGGEQKGQRTTRGFKNLELSVARGFGKRSGDGEEGGEEGLARGGGARPLQGAAAASRLRWFGGTGAERGIEGEESADDARKEASPFPWQFGPGSRFPDQWLAEEVAGNPGLAQVLVRRFVDEDGDGEVTAEEMLRPFAS